MKKIFAEVGFGNETFLSTEVEEGTNEYRVSRFVMPDKIRDFYFRFWIFKTVFVLSTADGFMMAKRDKNRLKILFGIGGEQ